MIVFPFQTYDDSVNISNPVDVTVSIMKINDKKHTIFLDGVQQEINYNVDYTEEEDPVIISNNLRISDNDVGEWNFTMAVVSITESKP